jgi:TDG/mug DNA glycosylase family protein
MTATPPLPDVLRDGLDLVFVGTAAGRKSAAVSAYYAHPGNRFWRTLAAVGLTPRLYLPHEFPRLLDLGIGFTDMSKSAIGMDHEIPAASFDSVLFTGKIQKYKPKVIAFTSKKAASVWLNVPTGQIALGRQDQREAFPVTFVLPSPSGAATRYWDERPWRELAAIVRRS